LKKPPIDEIKNVISLISENNLSEAEYILKELIRRNIYDHHVYGNMAVICSLTGRYEEMTNFFNKAFEINPNYFEGYNNLGFYYLNEGNLINAKRFLEKSLDINPYYPEALNNYGSTLIEIKKSELAIPFFKKAISLKPDFLEAINNLGISYLNTRKFLNAKETFLKGLKINPNFIDSLNGLGKTMQELGDFIAAQEILEKSIKLNPNFPDLYTNLGYILYDQKQFQKSIIAYKKALNINPNCSATHNSLALALLIIGDYKNGLEEYEWRFKTGDQYMLEASPKGKIWQGERIMPNEELLVISEQGFGDTLQFMRYIILLFRLGIKVSFCAPKELHELIISSKIHPNPITSIEADKKSCKWIPLLSVPKYFEVSPQNTIINSTYIFPKNERINFWKSILSTEKRPIIGINWQGNPAHELTYTKGRSLPLEKFSKIKSFGTLLSLQKTHGKEQLSKCSFKDSFVKCQEKISGLLDFQESAAIIENCDLVITSDTSIAHLAGGLGKTTWLLLRDLPEWRWGLNTEKTFWYPSMRLFRQKERGDWTEVLERVSKELNSFFQK
tara:strand:- start:187 stop:1863 length:1677 start_codon:yes stop_codon:yes gene_type:complete